MSTTSSQRLKPTAIGVAAFFIILAGLKLSHSFINPLLLALFISIIFAHPVYWLKKRKVPSGLAIVLVILLLLGFYFVLNLLVGSALSMFIKDVQQHQEDLKAFTESTGSLFAGKGINIPILSGTGSLEPSKILHYTGVVAGKIHEMISEEVTFIFVSIFLMVELEIIKLKVNLMAGSLNDTITHLHTIGTRIRHYLSIKSATSLATGILIGGGLAIIGVDYPLLWGLLAFLLNYIPTIGSLIAAIPGITFSILQFGFPVSIWTIILYLIVNLVIGNVLEPRIMGKGMGLSTAVVFLSLLFWGFILGPIGMFLSIPLTMVIKIILEHHPRTHWIAVMLSPKEDVFKAIHAYSRQQRMEQNSGKT
jgi:predicted PurR-regulated permease PerM